MLAAEQGADYVMFGEPDADGVRPAFAAIEERIAWWAEVFEIPCVGYAASLDDIAPLVAAGADFVALGDFVWRDPHAIDRQQARRAVICGCRSRHMIRPIRLPSARCGNRCVSRPRWRS